MAVEDICNQALEVIGYPRRIGDIYEGSPAARAALDFYGQTRDELLTQGEWPFALREVALTAVVGQAPPTPWQGEWAYPADCLRVRYVRPGPLTGGSRNLDPQPVLFRAWNDSRFATPVRAILCDLASPVLIYTGKITDMATWEPGFTRTIIDALAKKFAFRLSGDKELVRARAVLAEQSRADGIAIDDMTPPEMAMPGARQPQPQQ